MYIFIQTQSPSLQEYVHFWSSSSFSKRILEVVHYINVMLLKYFHSLESRMAKPESLCKQKTADTWKLKKTNKKKLFLNIYQVNLESKHQLIIVFLMTLLASVS